MTDTPTHGIDPEQAAHAEAFGATPDQILEMWNRMPYIFDTVEAYGDALRAGASHAECLEALEAVGDLGGYAYAREVEATHAECLEAGEAEAIISDYAHLRGNGVAHEDAIARADKCNVD